jgi:VIT1/CCC1 family predicted Fe2+/Mn2+ transporter
MGRIIALTLIYVTFSRPAFAYIDAAIGSLVLQCLAAGFFTFMVAWRNGVNTVKKFFRRITGKAAPEENQQTDSVE